MATYYTCPDCGGTVVPRTVLPVTNVPPTTEFICMACNAPFRREDQQLVKVGLPPSR